MKKFCPLVLYCLLLVSLAFPTSASCLDFEETAAMIHGAWECRMRNNRGAAPLFFDTIRHTFTLAVPIGDFPTFTFPFYIDESDGDEAVVIAKAPNGEHPIRIEFPGEDNMIVIFEEPMIPPLFCMRKISGNPAGH